MKQTKNDQIRLKNMNRIALLKYIRANAGATRANLAELTGLTFMAIKKILEELMELGLICESGLSDSAVGRKSVTYQVNGAYRYTVGIHINMYQTRAALLSLNGEILEIQSLDMKEESFTSTELISRLLGLIDCLFRKTGVPPEQAAGIGVGVPGPVNPESGMVLTPPNMPQLNYLPLRSIIEERFGIKTFIQKDTNVLALGECWSGAAKGYSDVVYIDADIGIGSGYLFGGTLYQGVNSGAGEIGHITLDVNGPQCNCGSYGCLEALSSGISILREIEKNLLSGAESVLSAKAGKLTISDVFEATRQNDPLAITVMNQSAHYLGIAVGGVINLLDPQVVVIGGVLAHNYQPYLQIVRQEAFAKKINNEQNNRIVLSSSVGESGVIGAGEIVAEDFLSNEVADILKSKNIS